MNSEELQSLRLRVLELESENVQLRAGILNGTQAELERTRTLFERIFDMADFGICLIDDDGVHVKINHSYATLLGYTVEELTGVSYRTIISPEAWSLADERRAARQRGEEPGPVEWPVITRSGERRWIWTAASRVVDRAGQRLHLAVCIDITDRKEAEHQLAKQTEKLARTNEELERFAYTASHDLQEPIRTVVNFTQLLARRCTGKLSTEVDEYISLILEASNRMSRLVESLLEYSQAGEPAELSRSPIDMNRVVDAATRMMSFAVNDTGASVTHDDLPVVSGDEAQLIQLLQNLIGNAIKYRRPEEPPRVHVSAASRNGEGWVFSVSDNGLGFPSQYAENIFGIFKRLHGKKYSGTGIGLAICRKIVEHHGGRIWATSEEGRGSTFLFTLPSDDHSDGLRQ